ncbi:helical backbone metal receptor [Ekhidna sp.]|uniref:ABC transporter substrate-binding protein n=1 Tax=Ekhidna sp. TaxID=2608089 RepID=UPI003297D21D
MMDMDIDVSNVRILEDMMGREMEIHFPPKRIVSLVPSQTEFLIDIDAPVVGRTKFCIHPKGKVSKIPIVGGTKNFRFDEIRSLNPDLIIGNKEENYQEGIEVLSNDFPVWMSDIYTLEDSFSMMNALGRICEKQESARSIVKACKSATNKVKGVKSGKVIYLIWKNPWMAAGSNTFIDHLLTHLGYQNLITEERYPELSEEQITSLNPDKILFSSEPYPFTKDHLQTVEKLWPGTTCELVDGELHSWYGSRLKKWV